MSKGSIWIVSGHGGKEQCGIAAASNCAYVNIITQFFPEKIKADIIVHWHIVNRFLHNERPRLLSVCHRNRCAVFTRND
jgi:hypothetical protein